MRINTKCSIALHCILFIAIYENNLKITSEVLAKSTGCNAVIIRNILSLLQKAGIISITRGMGGAHLLKEACDLTLWDIYRSLEPNGLGHLMGVHPEPSPDCPVREKYRNNIKKIIRGN